MEFDERAGRLIQELRQQEGLTQTELAQAMTARGFPMHQQTILKIEKGARPLRLAEGIAIATILKTDVGLFDEEPVEATLSRWANDLEEAELDAITALEQWLRERRVAGESMRMLENAGAGLDEYVLDERLGAAHEGEDPAVRVAHMLGIAEERLRRDAEVADADALEAWMARLRERENDVLETLREVRGERHGERPEA